MLNFLISIHFLVRAPYIAPVCNLLKQFLHLLCFVNKPSLKRLPLQPSPAPTHIHLPYNIEILISAPTDY